MAVTQWLIAMVLLAGNVWAEQSVQAAETDAQAVPSEVSEVEEEAIVPKHAKLELAKTKTVTCQACHGSDGNGVIPEIPTLAGQNTKYLVKQLKDYKVATADGKLGRYDPIMTPLMQTITEQDISLMATFYSEQKVNIRAVDPKWVARGAELYRGGDVKKMIPSCGACHEPAGKGNAQAGFPMLSGQDPKYVIKQLKAYQAGKRKNDQASIMQVIAQRMSEEDIEAVAHYVSGLHQE